MNDGRADMRWIMGDGAAHDDAAHAGAVNADVALRAVTARHQIVDRGDQILDALVFIELGAAQPPGVALFTTAAHIGQGVDVACDDPFQRHRIEKWLGRNAVTAVGID